jgi:hypothetical protein
LVAGVSGLGRHLDELPYGVGFRAVWTRIGRGLEGHARHASGRCQDTSRGSMTTSAVGRVDRPAELAFEVSSERGDGSNTRGDSRHS